MAKKISRQRAYEQRNLAKGLCRRCPNKRSPTSNLFCPKHEKKSYTAQRKKNGWKTKHARTRRYKVRAFGKHA